MSCSYAEGLSPYENKGKLGQAEKFDDQETVDRNVAVLAEWIKASNHCVMHTGAGISTSAGIPDFRGPKGVWTLEKKGLKPQINISWDNAKPTKTHMAIADLVRRDMVKFVVSQNIDGLHLRSGIPRSCLAELHGNMFVDQCKTCYRQFIRSGAAPTVGQKLSQVACPAPKTNGRSCRGKLADFVLDWEHELPESDLKLSDAHSVLADLSIVMGSTMQIVPSGNLPTYTKKFHPDVGKLVIINLQPTKYDKKADLVIHDYVDNVIIKLFEHLGLQIPEYDPECDPVRVVKQMTSVNPSDFIEWTQSSSEAERLNALADELDGKIKEAKRIERQSKLRKRTPGANSRAKRVKQDLGKSIDENDDTIVEEETKQEINEHKDKSEEEGNFKSEIKCEEISIDFAEEEKPISKDVKLIETKHIPTDFLERSNELKQVKEDSVDLKPSVSETDLKPLCET